MSLKKKCNHLLGLFIPLCTFMVLSAGAEERSRTSVLGELVYKEFHDPGYVYFQTEAGKELEAAFYYRFISFEQIDKWARGEKFELVIHNDKGVGVQRKSDSTFFKVVFPRSDNPIEQLEKRCLDVALSTLDIAGCYYQSAEYWDRESEYLFHTFSQGASETVLTRLSDARVKWSAYEESLMDSFYTYGQEQGGTIMKIHSASLKSELSESSFYQIVRFFE